MAADATNSNNQTWTTIIGEDGKNAIALDSDIQNYEKTKTEQTSTSIEVEIKNEISKIDNSWLYGSWKADSFEIERTVNDILMAWILSYSESYVQPPLPDMEEPDLDDTDIVDELDSEYWEKYPNVFAPGYCTYYVANKKSVSWSWHAKDWFKNAKNKWEDTWYDPKEWSIVVFFGKWYNRNYGHVAIVKSINGDGSFTVSEMNAKRKWIVSERKVKIWDKRILGFIYAKDLKN